MEMGCYRRKKFKKGFTRLEKFLVKMNLTDFLMKLIMIKMDLLASLNFWLLVRIEKNYFRRKTLLMFLNFLIKIKMEKSLFKNLRKYLGMILKILKFLLLRWM
jgi:hypothetical protein